MWITWNEKTSNLISRQMLCVWPGGKTSITEHAAANVDTKQTDRKREERLQSREGTIYELHN